MEPTPGPETGAGQSKWGLAYVYTEGVEAWDTRRTPVGHACSNKHVLAPLYAAEYGGRDSEPVVRTIATPK